MPRMGRITLSTINANRSASYKSGPKTLATMAPFTPLTASSTLSLMGCEKLKSMPA